MGQGTSGELAREFGVRCLADGPSGKEAWVAIAKESQSPVDLLLPC